MSRRLELGFLVMVAGCTARGDDLGSTAGTLGDGLSGPMGDSATMDVEDTDSGGFDDDDDDLDPETTTGVTSSSVGESGEDGTDDTPGIDVVVQNHTGACTNIAPWCQTDEGALGPHAYAECFDDVGLAPPFDLVEVRYHIGQKQLDSTDFRIEVRRRSGGVPGSVIGTMPLTAADAAIGSHDLVLEEPIRIDASSFCVTLEGNEGFAPRRDPSNDVPGRAFFRAEACGIVDYVSLDTFNGGDFASNLCISATIRGNQPTG